MKNSNFTFIKLTALCLLLVSGTQSIVSQNTNHSKYLIGMGIGTHLSGNAHGAIYDASVSLYNGKHHFSASACIQKQKESLCGGGFKYEHMLTGRESFSPNGKGHSTEDNKIQLFVFAYAQYLEAAKLSKSARRQEECNTRSQSEENSKTDFSNVQLSTADVFAGFGVNTKISKNLVWSTSVGFGTYYHIDYKQGMYAEKIAPVIMLSTALRINHFKRY